MSVDSCFLAYQSIIKTSFDFSCARANFRLEAIQLENVVYKCTHDPCKSAHINKLNDRPFKLACFPISNSQSTNTLHGESIKHQ